jgi:hypothetical protein
MVQLTKTPPVMTFALATTIMAATANDTPVKVETSPTLLPLKVVGTRLRDRTSEPVKRRGVPRALGISLWQAGWVGRTTSPV